MAKKKTQGRVRKVRSDVRVYRSKAEQERFYQRIALITIGVVVGLIGLILVYALVNDLVFVPEQAITTVNDTGIKTKDFQERVRAERWFLSNEVVEAIQLSGGNEQILQALLSGLPPIPPPYTGDPVSFLQDDRAFARDVLEKLELTVLLEKEADRLDVEVDEGEVQAQVDEYFERWTNVELTPTSIPSETPETTPTPTALITSTPSSTPTATEPPTSTPLPTASDCEEGAECPTITPEPSLTPTEEPTEVLETLTPTATNTAIPHNQLEATFDSFADGFYDEAKEVAEVDREAVRDIFYLRALRAALRDEVTKDLPTEAVWADARHILISSGVEDDGTQGATFDAAVCDTEPWLAAKAEADDVYQALLDGEPFAAVALAVSDDPGSGAQGGNLGWADVENSYVEPFAEAIVNADIGVVLEPVCSQFGWHIIQVLDREIREVQEFQLRQKRQSEYDEWEQNLLLSADIERREDWTDRIPEQPTYEELLGDVIGVAEQ